MGRRSFSREFKLEAVRLVRERGVSVAQAARDLDLHQNMLRNWVRGFAADPAQGALSKNPLQAKHAPRAGKRGRDKKRTRRAPLVSRFARVRVHPSGEGTTSAQPEEWPIVEWPQDGKEPTKFWLSTLAQHIDFARMIDITMMRWRIERDYQELKQEVGLGHFEGRGWRGFHQSSSRGEKRSFRRPRIHKPQRTSWRDAAISSKNLPFPTVTGPEDPPLRPERHVPNSIETLRRRLNAGLVACCARPTDTSPRRRNF